LNLGQPYWLWLIAAALLAIAELIAPGIFLIWIAAAAAGTALLTLVFGVSIAFQFALFALLAIGSVNAGRRWYARHPVATDDPLLNDRTARLVGRTFVLAAPIVHGEGRIKVGDGVWNCRGPDCESGQLVRIVGARGTCLMVEPEPAALAADERGAEE
jgi:membrane protein implicated in regulation of membrane protease activity